MPIVILPSIANRIAELEASLEPFDTTTLSGQLDQLVGSDTKLTDDERLGCQAEILGLKFYAIRGDDRGPWGSYFGPIFSGQRADSAMVYIPDAREIGSEVIEYWKTRSAQTPHPALQARYADLAMEIGRIWNREHRSETQIELPRSLTQRSIDGHLEAVDGGLLGDELQVCVEFH